MDKTPNINVHVISTDTIKPSSPTPPHLKQYKLSYLNQILPLVPIFPTCGLVFYTTPPHTQPLNITHLKTTLSETLTEFYPLAGKINQTAVNCNDDGVPFIEAKANCSLSAFLTLPNKLDFMSKFLPPLSSLGLGDGEKPVLELTHVAIQIAVFTCGGVSIGWYDIHKIMDGISGATFLNYWAGLSSRTPEADLIRPDFESCVSAFPPTTKPLELPSMTNAYTKEQHNNNSTIIANRLKLAGVSGKDSHLLNKWSANEKVNFGMSQPIKLSSLSQRKLSQLSVGDIPGQHNNNSTIIVNSFVFKKSVICELKAKAVSKTVAKPTSFLAIAGFIWENLLFISKTVENDMGLKGSVLQVTLDLRARVDPPLHKGCIGNLALIAVAQVENQAEMPELVAEINSSISEMNEYRGEEGVESVMESWRKVRSTSEEYKDSVYRLTSWSRLGFNELDFGFGKPVRMIPTDGKMCEFYKNMIILNDYKGEDGDHGIEAWLFLEQKDMEALICKREFLAFVSLVN